jgi:hypothetical protein
LSLFYCGFKHERGCGVCGTRGLKASGSPCATLGASSSDGFLDWSASLWAVGSWQQMSLYHWVMCHGSIQSPCPTTTTSIAIISN